MKFKSKKRKINWKKVAIVVALLAVAGYQWYSQDGRLIDHEIIDVDDYVEQYDPPTSASEKPPTSISVASNETSSSVRAANNQQESRAQSEDQEFLKPIGGGKLESPAGLIYGRGGGGEHRVDHVMKHIRDDPTRPSHGVFQGDKETVLKLLDEAYEMVQDGSKYVKSEESRGNTAYTISMGRKIGYEGGQKGQRNGNRGLKSIRLVLDGNRVITAYPYR